MLITRKNLRGGRHLKTFPLVEENGLLGYQMGYCGCGCNERLLLRTIDAQEILAFLFYSQKEYKKLIHKLTPKVSFSQRLMRWLIGKLGGPVTQNRLVDNS